MVRILLLCGCLMAPGPVFGQGSLELDHVFITLGPGASEARVLEEAGFRTPSDTTRHQGQGTASVFLFFENGYLELLWAENAEELKRAEPELAARLTDAEADASPFGLGLRRLDYGQTTLPFATRSHTAEWMQPGSEIRIAEGVPPNEPFVFVVPEYMSWLALRSMGPGSPEQLRHPNGVKRITSLRLAGPGLGAHSEALTHLIQQEVVEVREAKRHFLELEFDHGRAGETFDARPTLPLVIRY